MDRDPGVGTLLVPFPFIVGFFLTSGGERGSWKRAKDKMAKGNCQG